MGLAGVAVLLPSGICLSVEAGPLLSADRPDGRPGGGALTSYLPAHAHADAHADADAGAQSSVQCGASRGQGGFCLWSVAGGQLAPTPHHLAWRCFAFHFGLAHA